MSNHTADRSAIATSSFYCDSPRVIPLGHHTPALVDPELLKVLGLGVLCKGKLVSKELELDALDAPVAKDWKMIELMAGNDRPGTIEHTIASISSCQSCLVVDRGQVIDALN